MPETEQLNPLEIRLDPNNPRLSAEEEGSDPAQLIKIMIDRFKIEELAESIIQSGYQAFDPVVGFRDNGFVVVKEGNRRVAVLKLLLNPDLAPERNRPRWRELSDAFSAEHRAEIEEIEIQVFDDQADVNLSTYMGFRHVTGILKWPALEKAGFIATLVGEGWDYTRIAKSLGSYPRHMERHYVAFRVVEQAKEFEIPGAEIMSQRFGVLLRALQTPGIRDYIGVDYPDDQAASLEPVPHERQEEFRSFVRWTFGTDEEGPIIKDSRQLSAWGKILASEPALAYLRRSRNPTFDRAWFKSGGQSDSVSDSLFTAADHLEEVVALVSELNEDENVIAGVQACARFFGQILVHFPAIGDEYGFNLPD